MQATHPSTWSPLTALGSAGPERSPDPAWWPWALLAVVLVLAAVAVSLVRRSRRRYERTHHVQDEHGNRVDPASLLDDDELETAADRALASVDDAVVASRLELDRRGDVPGAAAVLQHAADRLAEAFTQRLRLADDRLDDAERRRTASHVLDLAEEVDAALDQAADAVVAVRPAPSTTGFAALRAEAEQVPAVAEADPLVAELVDAAVRHVGLGEQELSSGDLEDAAAHERLAEQALAQAAAAAAAVDHDDPELRVATLVATRRGAVGALARARLRVGDLETARLQAEADVATWHPQVPRQASDAVRALLLAGVLVPADRRGLRTAFGGSSHGSGANAPFRGSADADRLVAAGFGGRRATDARPTLVRL
ncbi:MAG: hypothetical protein PGN07_08270 [Aeromicrobium erythreum]